MKTRTGNALKEHDHGGKGTGIEQVSLNDRASQENGSHNIMGMWQLLL
jgi:hypothetical protein